MTIEDMFRLKTSKTVAAASGATAAETTAAEFLAAVAPVGSAVAR